MVRVAFTPRDGNKVSHLLAKRAYIVLIYAFLCDGKVPKLYFKACSKRFIINKRTSFPSKEKLKL